MQTSGARTRSARIAGYARAAQCTDPTAASAPARAAFQARWYNATDPALPEKVRRSQAAAAKHLYYCRLANAGVNARQKAAGTPDKIKKTTADLAPVVFTQEVADATAPPAE